MFPVSRMINRCMMSVCSTTQVAASRSFGTSIPVILLRDMDDIKRTGDEYYDGSHTAKKGDIVTVKRGYARNFLIPRYVWVHFLICVLFCSCVLIDNVVCCVSTFLCLFRKMAMYSTKENKDKFSTAYAEMKAEKEAFVNVPVSSTASSGAVGAAAWSSPKSEESTDDVSKTITLAADAPVNAFTLARYSDGRGFLAFPVTANTVRRHMEACLSSGGSSENSHSIQVTTSKGDQMITNHVKITWLDLASPIRQVGTYPINVTLSYFESPTSTESLSVTLPIDITVKHTPVL